MTSVLFFSEYTTSSMSNPNLDTFKEIVYVLRRALPTPRAVAPIAASIPTSSPTVVASPMVNPVSLLWLGEGLQWISLPVFFGPENAAKLLPN